MIVGLIISAGNQSRFKSEIPKSLMPVGDRPLLQINIDRMSKFCDKVMVVCSFANEHFFTDEILGDAQKIVIESGKGSGDAVWKALNQIAVSSEDTCYIQWGDCLQDDVVYSRIKDNYSGEMVIPCTKEKSPYVQIIPVENDCVRVHFSKFNEPITEGYHDLSVFYGNAMLLKNKLSEFSRKITDENGNYVHKHKNEMEFLDVFNETNIKAKVVEITNYNDFSFNTLEQYADNLAKLLKK